MFYCVGELFVEYVHFFNIVWLVSIVLARWLKCHIFIYTNNYIAGNQLMNNYLFSEMIKNFYSFYTITISTVIENILTVTMFGFVAMFRKDFVRKR